MSLCKHEKRKSQGISATMNIYLFHKSSYADRVLMHLNVLRQQRLFTDVFLHAGGRSFPCHKAVLAACSRYFEAMFSGGMRESQASDVDFKDGVHPEVLKLLLDYAYTSRVIINEENAESLLEVGDMLEFQDIRDACAEFLEKNLHFSNCLSTLLLSDAHQCTRLHKLSWNMCLRHFPAICKTEDFMQLPKDIVVQLLSHDELETEDEKLVYEAVLNWVNRELEKRQCFLPELLGTVRLALLPAVFLMENVSTEELINTQTKSKALVDEAISCKLKILQNDSTVNSQLAKPRKTSHSLFLLGGKTFMCDKLYLIDQKAKEIILKAEIPSPRKEFSACAIGCKVYITGGRGSENGVSKDVWVYDTSHEKWSKAAPMLIARFGHGSSELKQCLYVVGGHTSVSSCLRASPTVSLKQVEKYDPLTNKWSMVSPLREGVSNAAVVSVKHKLFAFGGTSVTHEKLPKVQCYDPLENQWTVPASCPQPWRYSAAAVLSNHIFVMGGDTEFSACTAYKFSTDSYQWTKVGDVTAKRMSCQTVASGNKMYVVGGYFGTQNCKTLDCYDPTLDAWSSITTVPYSLIPTAFVSTWKQLLA
ncbi:ectoderm-neural cortex protein 1-like isoform X1 [Scomber scombrus]|uniref:ectoderm-neural cortex protein 1-like isoform X1 n=1 Tax=Scomber scombrus TaxID=13677 RepID=UPI002DDAE3E7|nr:ectoderm-neural cortex protein 1-like isoform X1 [Scomber scombrus]